MKLSVKSDEKLWWFEIDGKVYKAFLKAKEAQNKEFMINQYDEALKGLNLRDKLMRDALLKD